MTILGKSVVDAVANGYAVMSNLPLTATTLVDAWSVLHGRGHAPSVLFTGPQSRLTAIMLTRSDAVMVPSWVSVPVSSAIHRLDVRVVDDWAFDGPRTWALSSVRDEDSR